MKALVCSGRAAYREKRKKLFANTSLLGDRDEPEAILRLKQKWYLSKNKANFLTLQLFLN